ncbi:hypothetical protein [Silvanigrella aquatica]|uniref:Uncharacterized protein n=1 Tax=Silvanigrella aquatica TaxID=1915309 RepID=A0A1L4CYU7_9BACT|nr:hypothetical protein [Silvanigrella aquatica]APJ03105.1 hypothetical protein AXG55_03955 [Silvanigrella aquatica]
MGNAPQNNIRLNSHDKSIPVFVSPHEAQGFMNEVIRTSKNKKDKKNEIKKWWFWLGFMGGIFISSLGIFFTFTTVYFIQNSIMEKPNLIYEKVICEKK